MAKITSYTVTGIPKEYIDTAIAMCGENGIMARRGRHEDEIEICSCSYIRARRMAEIIREALT